MERRLKVRTKIKQTSVAQAALFAFIFSVLLFGCSQSVDEVKVSGSPPSAPGRHILMNTDLSGAASSFPTSVSRSMGDHSVGGNGLRTSAISASRRMISGIG